MTGGKGVVNTPGDVNVGLKEEAGRRVIPRAVCPAPLLVVIHDEHEDQTPRQQQGNLLQFARASLAPSAHPAAGLAARRGRGTWHGNAPDEIARAQQEGSGRRRHFEADTLARPSKRGAHHGGYSPRRRASCRVTAAEPGRSDRGAEPGARAWRSAYDLAWRVYKRRRFERHVHVSLSGPWGGGRS